MKLKLTFLVLFGLLPIILLSQGKKYYFDGGIVRMDRGEKKIYLVFTGGDFNEGTKIIAKALNKDFVKASFFFTGDFYRNPSNSKNIKRLIRDGHYIGAHSDKHLLYAPWENRDSLLVTKEEFIEDLLANYREMERFGVEKKDALYFMPPYEWYNTTISQWTSELGFQLINFSPGTRSNADYTTPDMGKRYVTSEAIMKSIFDYEKTDPDGLNGFILLLHVGTDSTRSDKFYFRLREMVKRLRDLGYEFERL